MQYQYREGYMKNIVAIEKIRNFNRFYTKLLGLLENKILKTKYSLLEARILFELHLHKSLTASNLVKELGVDPAYLSRILQKFDRDELMIKKRCSEDTRKQILELTEKGKKAFLHLQDISNKQIENLIDPLSSFDQSSLLNAMDQVQDILSKSDTKSDFITFRTHKTGDIGYLTYQHCQFYSREYGFDISFDSYVAGAMIKFIEKYQKDKERLWVVEQYNRIMGSIAIVHVDDTVAQLRWFLLEPEVHGKGIGKKLINDAVQFCREKKYKKVFLWTCKDLVTARRLYEREGFVLAKTENHQIWGQNLDEELWELEL